ncbi:MAG: PPC domain-containing protein, partial [Myxococcales bacterium]|nr:PPC domain-containing protein [Myxococcales bacterium]
LNWDEKYAAWVESMDIQAGDGTWYETFTLTTPWGKTLPAPKLECAELAIFLRITFAAWYNLPFYLTAVDGQGTRVYFGHFGARTLNARYKNTPKFGYAYKDYSDWSAEKIAAQGWPKDEKLRTLGLYGGGDEMDFVFEGAKAGGYFDEIHLNKRAGHFLRLTLAYFGSMHLAGSRNTFNIKPEALREGDVLVHRWQRQGIGHTLVVKQVDELDAGQLEAQVVSGSMPRRQPKLESPTSTKSRFTDEHGGGHGETSDGEAYAALGGGLKRFRVTKNVGGNWMNTWMAADEASWISDTDIAALSERPTTFDRILGEASPEMKRDALLEMIDDARNHLRQYPASCSARIKREDAFAKLYPLMAAEFSLSEAEVDAAYRIFEDYVFAKLEYTESKTCCWNSTTAAMFQIVMDYNLSLQETQCSEPEVFKCSGGGYEVFAAYAEATDRGHLWKAWSEDESCPQRDVQDDTIVESTSTEWCDIADGAPPSTGGCSDDGYEDNDSLSTAASLGSGSHADLAVCSGDDDYYAVNLSAGASVSISFDHSEGDLDLAIYLNGNQVDSSASVADSETVKVQAAGSYVVRVFGYQGAAGAYSLSF